MFGTVVTVSENKHTTDRSLAQDDLGGVAVNENYVVSRFQAGSRPLDLESLTQVVPLHEHDLTGPTNWRRPSSRPAKQPLRDRRSDFGT